MAHLIGTAGHVDHGKTTLIAALTGIDADRLPEEKARGMTIDLGFAYVDLPEVGRVGIVDVPGHERFVKNMLAGASGVDVALLCVAVDEGVMPQTREHFQILRLLEAARLVVALTKADLADPALIESAVGEVRDLLEGTPSADAPVVPVSAQTSVGLDELKNRLVEAVQSIGARPQQRGWFMPIDRVFTKEGFGTVVTGTLARGVVSKGDTAVLVPGSHRVRVRGVQAYGEARDSAETGMRTALNLSGAKREDLHRGQAVGSEGVMSETTCLNVRLAQVEPIGHGSRVRLHLGSGEFLGRVFLLDHAPGFAQLRLEESCACARGQRGVLRQYSPPKILAGCEVITPEAAPRRKNDPKARELLTAPSEVDIAERLAKLLQSANAGLDTDEICEALGENRQSLGEVFERSKEAGDILGFAGRWVSAELLPQLVQRVLEALKQEHAKSPQASALPRHAVLKATGLPFSAKEFDRLLSLLASQGLVRLAASGIAHGEHRIDLNPKQAALLERVAQALEAAGANAPHPRDVASGLGVPVQAVEEIARLGVETGRLVRVDDVLIYSAKTVVQIKSTLQDFGRPFTVAEFRDATQSSRKYALPLLQYFDETRFTKRVGDQRFVLGDKDEKR